MENKRIIKYCVFAVLGSACAAGNQQEQNNGWYKQQGPGILKKNENKTINNKLEFLRNEMRKECLLDNLKYTSREFSWDESTWMVQKIPFIATYSLSNHDKMIVENTKRPFYNDKDKKEIFFFVQEEEKEENMNKDEIVTRLDYAKEEKEEKEEVPQDRDIRSLKMNRSYFSADSHICTKEELQTMMELIKANYNNTGVLLHRSNGLYRAHQLFFQERIINEKYSLGALHVIADIFEGKIYVNEELKSQISKKIYTYVSSYTHDSLNSSIEDKENIKTDLSIGSVAKNIRLNIPSIEKQNCCMCNVLINSNNRLNPLLSSRNCMCATPVCLECENKWKKTHHCTTKRF